MSSRRAARVLPKKSPLKTAARVVLGLFVLLCVKMLIDHVLPGGITALLLLVLLFYLRACCLATFAFISLAAHGMPKC